MNEFILDLSGCRYITEVHWRIRDTFGFPKYYGENLDALWDMGCDYIGSDIGVFEMVKIKGVHTLPQDIRKYFLEKIMDVFCDIAEKNKNVRFELID